ncbi:methylated-DNA--[protein]-cysteine S-methyltransferase [Metabacillus sp. GX 13764]|uniref:methylated-DNA--[protein]-cysteine S-methyltransferase n=1 Tax=Metabacillus kandeliae TaxID=2900151 RepID=UPI001E5E382E|nr:methylated-DNA--[protein]-cysteine S-methyltransferase [Metabacillus kandeliae]MCD7034076.1 methylated-DNA--[protein]-cysteine S-methyltransferase [Metabacillus kandeliae]
MNKLDYQSPIGILEIIGDETAISSILFTEKETTEYVMEENTPAVMKDCYQQLDEYFNGKRKEFNLPYKLNGTVFQTSVWNALNSIPYAKTGSYRDIATVIGNEKAIRAVGNANSKNKLTIVIPCHRIIGSNASLTGYAGGLWRKKWLLEHEQKY